ncbi:MAG: FAD-binding protein [Halanaerobiales bacterium]
MKKEKIETDILIIGGGTAGCFAAVTAAEEAPKLDITVVEKAYIERSGCLAAGVNAINAYLNPGETPETYLEYVREDFHGLVREDLVYTIGQNVNRVTEKLDEWGLPIKKDEYGNYLARSSRSIKIDGEGFKPLLAARVNEAGARVLNRTAAVDYIVEDGRVRGCYAFNIRQGIFYTIEAKAVICATGRAAGIYKPTNTGKARNRTWYPPFNTGAGYALGIRAGAEMTTFEMRFVALRVKGASVSPGGRVSVPPAPGPHRNGQSLPGL